MSDFIKSHLAVLRARHAEGKIKILPHAFSLCASWEECVFLQDILPMTVTNQTDTFTVINHLVNIQALWM
jgi:hypothetical protein